MNLTEQLASILNDLQGVWVETALILGAILVLLAGLIRSSKVITKLLFTGTVIIAVWLNASSQMLGELMMSSIHTTKQAIYFGSLFLIVSLLILLFPRNKKHATEFYFFILAILSGSILTMKANSLLIIYLTIELVSFSSYILTNFSGKKQGYEAGIKYLLFGAISSAVMLFGLGLIYGSTGVFSISGLGEIQSIEVITLVGMIMMLFGILFKISIAPAHLWVPATYQSAPADAAAFMSIVPKLAGLVLLQRILRLDALGASHWIFELVLGLGMLTIVMGTLGAFRQTHARRMISFGAIAHSGFMLPFALINSSTAQDAFWWYAVVYAIMNLGAFYMLDQYERKDIYTLSAYSTTNRSVWMGAGFTFILISLVGLPPMAGFMAKLFLFTTLWEHYLSVDSILVVWYLVIAILATVGSLFYYLQIPRHIFLAKDQSNQSTNFSLWAKIIATLFTIGLLLLFFVPKLVIVMQQLLNNVNE
ncbi:NADH-quinone oxidoreductase subunit N [Ekhidna sp. To15]|uniref:NADH-quinone oxidoreductase subunit N n=1 Tax=Ekhidna sp. To15 TaxID=3395267 RepID=UPI003F52829B